MEVEEKQLNMKKNVLVEMTLVLVVVGVLSLRNATPLKDRQIYKRKSSQMQEEERKG